MRSLIAFAILLAPVAAGATPPITGFNTPNLRCLGTPSAQWAGTRGAAASKLGELPPGDLRLAVVREVEGCPQDTVIRTNYGGNPARAPKRK